MRLRSFFISSGSHFILLNTLRAFLAKVLGLELESNSLYLSSVSFSSSRTLRHPLAISCNSVFCWLVGSRSSKKSSISRRTLERLLTLLRCRISSHKTYLLDDLLLGDCLKLTRSINKLLPDIVRKLEYGDEIANTESKAHRDLAQGVVIAA